MASMHILESQHIMKQSSMCRCNVQRNCCDLQGAKGAMLKQTRPAKFKMPVSYVNLLTEEELSVPEVMQRANSHRHVSLPSKIVKRRARLKSFKGANSRLAGGEAQVAPLEPPKEAPPAPKPHHPVHGASWSPCLNKLSHCIT